MLYYLRASQEASGGDLWSVPVPGRKPGTPVLATRANESAPIASPDGRWLAYTSSASGTSEVRVGRLPDLTAALNVTSGGGRPIGWTADSQRLFYTGSDAIWEVRVGPDGPDQGTRRVAFHVSADAISASVMPDGQTAVLLRGGPMESDLIVRQGALPVRRE